MLITTSSVLVLFSSAESLSHTGQGAIAHQHCKVTLLTVTRVYSVSGAHVTFVLDEFQQISFTLVFQVVEDHLNGCLVLQHNDTEPQFSVLHRLAEESLFSVIQIMCIIFCHPDYFLSSRLLMKSGPSVAT